MSKRKTYFVRVIIYDGDLIECGFYSGSEALECFDFIVGCIISREMKTIGAVYLCVNDYVYRSYVNHHRLRQNIKYQQLKDL